MRRNPNQSGGPFEEMFLYAFPNPERVGCPGSEVLRGLATKELPISHPARLHLMKCSPCFREFRQLQVEIRSYRRKRRTRVLLASAALLVFAALLGWFWKRQIHRPRGEVAVNHVPVGVSYKVPGRLDYSVPVLRGPGKLQKDQVLSRNTGPLTITLRPESDAGPYQIEIREAGGQQKTLATYSGTVSVNPQGKTILQTEIDLSAMSPGLYVMAWRPQGTQLWNLGPFLISD